MRKLVFSILTALVVSAAFAQKVKTVEATYTYIAPDNMSPAEARRTALERAKVQALADAFGTLVSQTSSAIVNNREGQSTVDFLSIGGSDVKGEWIETLSEDVKTEIQQGSLIFKASVRGKAREIVSSPLDLKVHLLRNGTESKFESSTFRDGDDMYLSFSAPVDGFLAVYLIDDDRQAFCLLPYRNQTDGIFPIAAGEHYTFFHTESAPQNMRSLVDEYYMICNRETEQNAIYVIFSPKKFIKASDRAGEGVLPRTLPYADFQKWLTKCRTHDTDMNVRIIPISLLR